MAFIRKVKTASGATAVQLAHKSHGRITRIEHIGSAHNASDLDSLVAFARQRLDKFQLSLFQDVDRSLPIELKKSFSGLLFDLLKEQYASLGLSILCDEDFALLCIARIVEPTSKLDSIRVLSDLGVDGLTKDRLYRCLKRVATKEYRTSIAKICVAQAQSNPSSAV